MVGNYFRAAMLPPTLAEACLSILKEINDKCAKLGVTIDSALPPALAQAQAAITQTNAHAHAQTQTQAQTQWQAGTLAQAKTQAQQVATREVWALTYDALFAALEELMLVETRRKSGIEQALAYLHKLSFAWSETPDPTAFLEGDALQFWVSSFIGVSIFFLKLLELFIYLSKHLL